MDACTKATHGSLKTEACPVLTEVLSSPALFSLIIMLRWQTSSQAKHCFSCLSSNPMEEGYSPEPPQWNILYVFYLQSFPVLAALYSAVYCECCVSRAVEALHCKEQKWLWHFCLTGYVERQAGKHWSVTHRHPWPSYYWGHLRSTTFKKSQSFGFFLPSLFSPLCRKL